MSAGPLRGGESSPQVRFRLHNLRMLLMKFCESDQGNIEKFYTLAAYSVNNVLSVSSGHADQNRDPSEVKRTWAWT